MKAVSIAGDVLGGILVAFAVPVVILAVGAPIALAASFALGLLGLL